MRTMRAISSISDTLGKDSAESARGLTLNVELLSDVLQNCAIYAAVLVHRLRKMRQTWITFPPGIVTTIAACVLLCKLLAEPLYVLSQNLLLLKLWLIVETAATFLHCLTMYIILSKQRFGENLFLYVVDINLTIFSHLQDLGIFVTSVLVEVLGYFLCKAQNDKGIVFASSQSVYEACLFLGYWSYFVPFHAFRSSDLFPFRNEFFFCTRNYNGL
ncbi:hypothetical protein NC651_008682 [Populus alba x Populus x berolinensis]|nr:hypothetical protein NC651_008682 [Populus alba x Populus x berolinensis]